MKYYVLSQPFSDRQTHLQQSKELHPLLSIDKFLFFEYFFKKKCLSGFHGEQSAQ